MQKISSVDLFLLLKADLGQLLGNLSIHHGKKSRGLEVGKMHVSQRTEPQPGAESGTNPKTGRSRQSQRSEKDTEQGTEL